MKQRLLVMNGQRLLQREREGQWNIELVEKAGAIKPGVYNIHLATPPDKHKVSDGVIVHVDETHIYQQVGKNFVRHDLKNFDIVQEIGSNSSIRYDGDRAVVTSASNKLRRGIS